MRILSPYDYETFIFEDKHIFEGWPEKFKLGWKGTAYVCIPKSHKFYEVNYEKIIIEDNQFNQEITYAGKLGKLKSARTSDQRWVIGFDTFHSYNEPMTIEIVKEQLQILKNYLIQKS